MGVMTEGVLLAGGGGRRHENVKHPRLWYPPRLAGIQTRGTGLAREPVRTLCMGPSPKSSLPRVQAVLSTESGAGV